MTLKKQLYSPEEMTAAISMIAAAIRRDFDTDGSVPYALVGLYNQGVPLAERICDEIERATGRRPEHGRLDISMYRDDVGLRSGLPLIRETVIPFNIDGHKIILVDDVLSSGRTIRAALDAITDYGRPNMIRLAVLVDRGDPEYPIRADYVGFKLDLDPAHKVAVQFDEDGVEAGIFEVNWQQKPLNR